MAEIKEISNDSKIAIKVRKYYTVVGKDKVANISLEPTEIKVYPSENNFEGKVYTLYKGKNLVENNKIDNLFNKSIIDIKDIKLSNLNDLFYLREHGIYEIYRDIVTKQTEGFDFAILSLGQFPNYDGDIYISNKNLTINGYRQSIAYINKDNEVKFYVNLPEDEKNKVIEIRDKKEIISSLIKKDIAEHGVHFLSQPSEEYMLKRQKIEKGQLKNIEHIPDSIYFKGDYDAELILDCKKLELKQNLKHNGSIEHTNIVIKYDSYHKMLRSLPYLLDDNHRNVLLTGFIYEQLRKEKEQELKKDETITERKIEKEFEL